MEGKERGRRRGERGGESKVKGKGDVGRAGMEKEDWEDADLLLAVSLDQTGFTTSCVPHADDFDADNIPLWRFRHCNASSLHVSR